jgi:hypothetical protein
MKSLLVIYAPLILGATEVHKKARKDAIRDNLMELRTSELSTSFDIVVIEDPDRDKVETQVHFKPE